MQCLKQFLRCTACIWYWKHHTREVFKFSPKSKYMHSFHLEMPDPQSSMHHAHLSTVSRRSSWRKNLWKSMGSKSHKHLRCREMAKSMWMDEILWTLATTNTIVGLTKVHIKISASISLVWVSRLCGLRKQTLEEAEQDLKKTHNTTPRNNISNSSNPNTPGIAGLTASLQTCMSVCMFRYQDQKPQQTNPTNKIIRIWNTCWRTHVILWNQSVSPIVFCWLKLWCLWAKLAEWKYFFLKNIQSTSKCTENASQP